MMRSTGGPAGRPTGQPPAHRRLPDPLSGSPGWRRRVSAGAAVLATVAGVAAIVAPSSAPARTRQPSSGDGLGIQPGKIKHVWLIILENKSFDATFTGLNKNTYLWRTLPAQGVLLKNYYGTGHGSFDNYLTLVSGQATQPDAQVDCPYYDHFSGHVDTSGSLATDPNYGQFVSAQGPNAAPGARGHHARVRWLSPDMCSDGHDAVCYGNNLSGGFSNANTARRPVNYTGGLYAADLFLEHVIPEIEASPAFKDGGLIDITFDEAFPPFTYTGNSFANSKIVPADSASIIAHDDSAAETLFGRSVHFEPTGPNTPLAKNAAGDELYPGPGGNDFIDRPADCVPQTIPSQPAGTCILLGGGHVPGARTDTKATAAPGRSSIADNSIAATDKGRSVSGPGIPAGAFVGEVTDTFTPATAALTSGGFDDLGSFALVNASGGPLLTNGPVSGVVLGARTPATDPLYDATDPTPGGGDTGSVLISPYIRPGSVSTGYYDHYSWLRTIEDLFNVGRASKGLDGKGHIGYAAQPGLAPFGADVFTYPKGRPLGRRSGRYGGIPSWLPQRPAAVGALVRASLTHPALAIQGDSVSVKLKRGSVLIRTVGPSVPREGGFPVPATSPSTFIVTLSAAAEAVPLSSAAFTIVDELGHVQHPSVRTTSGGAVPRRVLPGHTVSLSLHSVLPIGNGRLVWAPAPGRAIAAWDFDLELD